uniref:Protein kinase superfamily protein n=1 Tax=Tanacetum cinerariifolium TaxID=118510 RepID=A0A699KPC5_TANCI|nr:protein kinase superfamily protein [Tanacetum cinerariifolium]
MLFIDVFGDEAFQKVYDIHKVETTALLGYKMMAYCDKTPANQKFVTLIDKMISERLDKHTLATKKP